MLSGMRWVVGALVLFADGRQAHFGKFGSHYINRDFYFDVHPPLGKMLVGLAGVLSGYNGGFEFKSGVQYPPEVPYTAIRVMMASFGVALVPIAWWTAGELGWSKYTRHWVTICVLCGRSSSYGPDAADQAQMSAGSVSRGSYCSTRCSYSSHLPQCLVWSNSTTSDTSELEDCLGGFWLTVDTAPLAKIGGSGSSSRAGQSAASAASSGWASL